MKIKLNPTQRIKIFKTISYRLWASTACFLFLLVFTKSMNTAAWFTGVELVFKPIIYLIHEYIWLPYEKKYMDADSKATTGQRV